MVASPSRVVNLRRSFDSRKAFRHIRLAPTMDLTPLMKPASIAVGINFFPQNGGCIDNTVDLPIALLGAANSKAFDGNRIIEYIWTMLD
jgi:hypothetical protein